MNYELYPKPPKHYKLYIFRRYILPWLIIALIMFGFWYVLNNLANLLWIFSTPLVEAMEK